MYKYRTWKQIGKEIDIDHTENFRIVSEEDWQSLMSKISQLESDKLEQSVKVVFKQPIIRVNVQDPIKSPSMDLIREIAQELISNTALNI